MNLRSPTLFWRTFLLIVLLILASLAAWVQSFRLFEREPRALQIAQQVVSIVNITRAALLYSDPALRRELLAELADNEGIRIVPLEPGDQTVDFPDAPLLRLVRERVIAELGPQTRLAAAVNGVPGNWVSFTIEGDGYWVYIERDPLSRDTGTQWIRWAIVATILSLLAAVAITRVVNQPLARLSRAARELGAGHVPAPLPDKGPAEIRTVNQSFNRMVADLGKLEQDRAVLLAGISHDLRTPLTRLRLELEINDLPAEARAAMAGDIEQMDSIVRQFLDYARREPQQPAEDIDLSALVQEALAHARLDATIEADIAHGVRVGGYRTELVRALDNLLTNASRYGRDADGQLGIEVQLAEAPAGATLEIADRGTGIAPQDIERLLRPFERGDSARSGGTGAGLGLAIVDRIARLHRARFELLPNEPSGLRARLVFPRRA
jgi:two-component system osmolarity sensor histidine kinase EnvZ